GPSFDDPAGRHDRQGKVASPRELFCFRTGAAEDYCQYMPPRDRFRKTVFVALLAVACGKQAPTTETSLAAAAAAVGIPGQDVYEQNMRQFGTEVCQKELMQTGASLDARLG